MAVTAYKTPGSVVTADRDGKVAWTNPDRAATSNNSWATNDVPKLDYTDWLRATQFGFTTVDIPSGSTIDGIEVKIEGKAEVNGKIMFARIFLRDAGGQTGDNKADLRKYTTSDSEITYPEGGGSADDWNAALSDSDVRASTFGVDLSATNAAASGDPCFAYIDCISIRIYYTAGVAHEKALSDTVTISDSIVKAVGLNKADTATIADALSKSVGLVKADSVAITDSVRKAMAMVKADTVTITDSISKAVSLVKADTMAITDSMTSHIGIGLTIVLSDLVTITDRLVGVLTTRVLLKQRIARMQVKGMDIARMGIKKMGIDKMPLYRWITRRWTA